MNIRITNLSREMQVFNLSHEECCTETECFCSRAKVGTTEHNPKTGQITQHIRSRRLPGSVTLQPTGEDGSSTEIPVTWGASASMVNARRAGTIRFDEIPVPAEEPETEATPAIPPAEPVPALPPAVDAAPAEQPAPPAPEPDVNPPAAGRKAKSKE